MLLEECTCVVIVSKVSRHISLVHFGGEIRLRRYAVIHSHFAQSLLGERSHLFMIRPADSLLHLDRALANQEDEVTSEVDRMLGAQNILLS